jgi:hypothetical protein
LHRTRAWLSRIAIASGSGLPKWDRPVASRVTVKFGEDGFSPLRSNSRHWRSPPLNGSGNPKNAQYRRVSIALTARMKGEDLGLKWSKHSVRDAAPSLNVQLPDSKCCMFPG